MPYERWGSLSVRDHKDPALLAADLLLYDRLVIPIPTEATDDGREVEWGAKAVSWWETEGWQPDILRNRLEELGALAITRPWNPARRSTFAKKMDELKAIKDDVGDMSREVKEQLPYHLTRRILAQEKLSELPPDVSHVNVVCAYQSEHDFKADWYLDPKTEDKEHVGLIFGHHLAVPDIEDPKEVLSESIRLTKDPDFREKRREFYEWQLRALQKGFSAKGAIEEMHYLITKYNQAVKEAVGKVYLKAAFTLAGVALGLAGAALWNPIAVSGSILAIVEFATFDRKPVIEAGEATPAAMFHDIEQKLVLKLTDKSLKETWSMNVLGNKIVVRQ